MLENFFYLRENGTFYFTLTLEKGRLFLHNIPTFKIIAWNRVSSYLLLSGTGLESQGLSDAPL